MENKKVDLSKFVRNKDISGGKSLFVKGCWFLVSALFFQSACFPFSRIKVALLKLFGAKAGRGVNIKPQVYIKFPWRLKLGNNVWIGEKAWIANEAKVSIEDNVCISHGVLLLTAGHDYKKTSFDVYAKPIVIKEGVWLGAQSSVTGGITVGSHAMLSIKSVANSSLEPYAIYRGNPAVKIRDRILKE